MFAHYNPPPSCSPIDWHHPLWWGFLTTPTFVVTSHEHLLRCNILTFSPCGSFILLLWFSADAKELVFLTARVTIYAVTMVGRQVSWSVDQLDAHCHLSLLLWRRDEFVEVMPRAALFFVAAADSNACCFCSAANANSGMIGERAWFPKF